MSFLFYAGDDTFPYIRSHDKEIKLIVYQDKVSLLLIDLRVTTECNENNIIMTSYIFGH